jgi:DNA mismatch repair protein MutS
VSLDVIGGRHPSVEASHHDQAHPTAFVSNDCQLNESSNIWFVTGPNMGGKSTFLRQNALIVMMAQMGSFVPATSARVGIVDGIFTRVGGASGSVLSSSSNYRFSHRLALPMISRKTGARS